MVSRGAVDEALSVYIESLWAMGGGEKGTKKEKHVWS